MANLRAAQKEMTRRLLLESALDLFESNGYAATTIDEIASKAGTTRVTFYAYFPSKSDLMRALIAEYLNESLQRMHSPEGGSTAPDLVEAVTAGTREQLDSWIHAVAERWPTVRPLLRIGRDAAAVDPELRDLVDAWMEEAIDDIVTGLNHADRFPAESRRFRGVLAMGQLDYVAQHWTGHNWGIGREPMLALLADSWAGLLIEP